MTPTLSTKSTSELSLVEAIPPPALGPNRKKGLIALKRCCAAWKHAYDAYMEGKDGSEFTEVFAAHDAGPAFCKAMPLLVGYENIRDFIACVAHGILINAIPEKRANQLLYAAQVALVSLNYEPKPRKSVERPGTTLTL
jgi:hypothetical protein